MTSVVEPMIKSRRTSLALPRQRASVAMQFTPSTFPPTGTIVRHSGLPIRGALAVVRHFHPVFPAQSYPSTEFETTINTHRADAVPAV
jgi:hypothetical protein